MSRNSFGSWEAAAQHPIRSLVVMFVVGSFGTGAGSYYDGVTPRSPWESAAIGIGCGAVLVVVGWKRLIAEGDGHSPEVAIRPLTLFNAGITLVGLAICIWGLAVANWGSRGVWPAPDSSGSRADRSTAVATTAGRIKSQLASGGAPIE